MRKVHYTFNLSAALLNLIIIELLFTAARQVGSNTTIITANWPGIIIASLLYWFMLTLIATTWIIIMSKVFESRINSLSIIIIAIFTTICAYIGSIASLYGIESLMNNFTIIGSWQKIIIAGIILHSIQAQAYSQ